MNIFTATYTDYIKFNEKQNEDCFWVSPGQSAFVIADGVTRVRIGKRYTYPNGAKQAAELFCKTVGLSLEKSKDKDAETVLETAFYEANKTIHKLNITEGIAEKLDWYVNEYFSCVGVVGFIRDTTLYYGYVGDCGLAVWDAQNRLRMQTKDQVKESSHYQLMDEIQKKQKLSKKQRHIYIRKNFQNHSSGKYYGTFNGEEGVESYYIFGKYTLSPGDLVVFYSDGFVDYIQDKEFLRILRSQDNNLLNLYVQEKAALKPDIFGHDRTFVSFIAE